MDPYGYSVPSGYLGRLPDGEWRLFSTEGEYDEIFYEYLEELG